MLFSIWYFVFFLFIHEHGSLKCYNAKIHKYSQTHAIHIYILQRVDLYVINNKDIVFHNVKCYEIACFNFYLYYYFISLYVVDVVDENEYLTIYIHIYIICECIGCNPQK